MMYGDLHESYFDHGCSIIHEKDVLQIDIKGNSCTVQIKRWWYNLFLLSYSNKRTRLYYNSSHAVKVERARQFRRYRNCIHPLSRFKNFWDFFVLHVILINKIIFHHTSSLISAELPLIFYFIGVALEIIIIFDIYVHIKSGYIEKATKKVILDLSKAREHYFSTKLFLHSLGAIPMHIMMFLRYGMDVGCLELCKSNKFMCTLVFLNVFSLVRFIEASSYWDRERKTYVVTCFFRFFRICMVAFMTMAQFISLTDTISLLRFITTGRVATHSYYFLVMYAKNNFRGLRNYKLFAYEISRTFRLLLLFNFGFLSKKYFLDMLVALTAYFIACVFYVWGLIEVFSWISREWFAEDQIITNKAASIRLAKTRQLPDKICLKLRQYYDFNMSFPLLVEKYNGLYKSLPLMIRKEVMYHSYGRLLTRIPYFSSWPTKVIEDFALIMKEEVFLKHDVVAEAGVQGDGLYVLEFGMLAVYSASQHDLGRLIDGDFFGELSLVTDKEIRTSYVVAVTSCKILILEKSAFRLLMREYPVLFFELKDKLRSKYKQKISRAAAKSSGPMQMNTRSPH